MRGVDVQSSSGRSPRIDAIRSISVHTGGLLSHRDTRASQFSRKVLQLGQAIGHPQHPLAVVDVHAGPEGKRGNGGRKHVDQTRPAVIDEEVATTALQNLRWLFSVL